MIRNALAALALFLLVSCGGGGGGGGSAAPASASAPLATMNAAAWEIGPVIAGGNYSLNMPPHPVAHTEGWALELPDPSREPHYVTMATGSLAGKSRIRMAYRVEGGPIVAAKDPAAPSILTLYFQRAGDNWSGVGEFQTYRWFASFASHLPITAGEHVMEVQFDSNWTALGVSREQNPQGFQAALENAARVGFVLGGGTGLGHGVRATAPARIIVLAFDVL
jgi:hypothetical protein